MIPPPLDLSKLKVLPLASRHSLTNAEEILIDPARTPPPCPDHLTTVIADWRKPSAPPAPAAPPSS